VNADKQPALFIGGAGCSGTTLFVDMLGLHHSLSPVYETDFVLSFLEFVKNQTLPRLQNAVAFSLYWATPLPYRPHSKRSHEKYHHGPHYILFTLNHMKERIDVLLKNVNVVSPQELILEISRMIQTLFQCHCELDQKKIWINKTPNYVFYLGELLQVFPDMKFVHCIRDGRDVACSVVTRPWGPKSYREAALWWKFAILNAREFGSTHPEAYCEVKYEDLLTNTESTLKRLFTFLKVEDESSLLFKVYNDGKNDIRLMKSRIGTWKDQFGEQDTELFWKHAGNLLFELGYSQ
jgi:hypothetical protein